MKLVSLEGLTAQEKQTEKPWLDGGSSPDAKLLTIAKRSPSGIHEAEYLKDEEKATAEGCGHLLANHRL